MLRGGAIGEALCCRGTPAREAQPHIALAAPVLNDKTVKPWASLNWCCPYRILKAFEDGLEYGGEIFLQVVDSGRITLAQSSPGATDHAEMDGEVSVAGTLATGLPGRCPTLPDRLIR